MTVYVRVYKRGKEKYASFAWTEKRFKSGKFHARAGKYKITATLKAIGAEIWSK